MHLTLYLTPIFRVCLLLISLLCWPTLHAEDDFGNADTTDAAPEEDSVSDSRWYQVELMIYRQSTLGGEITELWSNELTLAYPDNWVLLQTPEQYSQMTGKKSAINTPFILLDKKQPVFTQLEKKLQLNRNDILFHSTWRQLLKRGKTPDEEVNPSILVKGGRKFDDRYELEGSVSLRLSRYLHFKTNLWVSRFIPASTEIIPTWPALPSFPVAAANAQTGLAETLPQYQVDEIVLHQQSRRMRSYEVHYIDHPKIGMVIQLIPLDTNTMLPIPKNK